jgi:putative hydrolase of the HAD superfamily
MKKIMNKIKAIGFDLFNTLIIAKPHILDEAMRRLINSLRKSGVLLDNEQFKKNYQKAALTFVTKAQKDGRETHNRFWICAALQSQGYDILPDDARIAIAVEAYFSAFFLHCSLVPDTKELLSTLRNVYRLGLLTNFTHGPAAREIIDTLGLSPFFDVVLISGELGYRKPHPFVFHQLIEHLGVEKGQILYVGDDPQPDISGAQKAGLQPVLTTYVRDQNIPFVPGILFREDEKVDYKVPKISTWNELLSLLEKE